MWLRELATDAIVMCAAVALVYRVAAFLADELARRLAAAPRVVAGDNVGSNASAPLNEKEELKAADAVNNEELPADTIGTQLAQPRTCTMKARAFCTAASAAQVFPAAATLLFCIVLGVLLARGGESDATAATVAEMLGPTYYHGANYVPYLLLARFATHDNVAIPLLDCAYYSEAPRVHTLVLDRAAGGTGTKRSAAAGSAVAVAAVDVSRARTARRCALETAATTMVAALPSPELLGAQPPFWQLPAPLAVAGGMAVRDLLVTANRTALVRVWMVRQARGSAQYRLLPTVVSEAALRHFAGEWYARMLERARVEGFQPDPPCLCPEHLGIVGSDMILFFDARVTPPTWRLLLDVRIVYEVPGTEDKESALTYNPQRVFPFVPNAPYDVDTVHYHGRVDVQYTDVRALLDTVDAAVLIRKAEPAALVPLAAETTAAAEAELPLAAVVSLRALDPFPRGHQFADFDNGCLQHCLEMARRARGKLAPPSPAGAA